MILFFAHQILFPLRHHLYPGNVAWNELGHRYSWRMKLRDKICDVKTFVVDHQNNRTYSVDWESHLYGKQPRKSKPNPELVVQFANYLGRLYQSRSGIYPSVYAEVE